MESAKSHFCRHGFVPPSCAGRSKSTHAVTYKTLFFFLRSLRAFAAIPFVWVALESTVPRLFAPGGGDERF
jgi:hypothetical protein